MSRRPRSPRPPSAPALRARLFRTLGRGAEILRCVAAIAASVDARAYLVGGPVRDLLLGRPVHDLDVLLSDSLVEVATRTSFALDAQLELRPEFLTATLEAEGLRLDLAQARREGYPRPGALPRVQPASVVEDLRRRDFSVNALALPLDDRGGRSLLDAAQGRLDLERRRLRTLHPESFTDDPTRMLRAARYCARLRFRLAAPTQRELDAAREDAALDTVSSARVRHEIERLLDEEEPARAAAWTARLDLFAAVARGWSVGAAVERALARLGRAAREAPWPEADAEDVRRSAGLRLLFIETRARARTRSIARLGIDGRPAHELEGDVGALAGRLRALAREPSPGRLDARLGALSEPALLALYCVAPAKAARAVGCFARELRRVPDPVDGRRALALGLRGPEVGALLRAARARALDGRPTDAAWERRWLAARRRMR